MSGTSKKNTSGVHSDPPVSTAGESLDIPGSCSRMTESPAAAGKDRWLVPGVCIFLAAMVWVVFGQTLGHQFVNYDDNLYVYENPEVTRGLTLQGIIWAFTHVRCSNWHPLTWISHMLDCQLYGLNPGGHHFTNILLHAATAILLFLVMRRMTGFLWRSAFVAAVFAIHPLRVESVAWVAERKDVLSGMFFMLTLWAYVRYVQGVTVGRVTRGKWQVAGTEAATEPIRSCFTFLVSGFYWLTLLLFALGLMSKPMLVTLPLVLLLLDYWPLGRVAGDPGQGTGEIDCKYSTPNPRLSTLVFEKLPLFGLAAASCVATVFAQTTALQPFENISLALRFGNASISCVAYLGQMFWPTGLAVLYPFPGTGVAVSAVVLSVVLLVGITGGVIVLRRRCPCLLTGWLWYLIMLLPVIGIVQVGAQARADRYTYLPQIGLYLLLTWAAAELSAGWRYRRLVLGGFSTVILAALMFCARSQAAYWRNSESLWTRALACTSDNCIGHYNYGITVLKLGRVDEAITNFQQALRIKPNYWEAHNNLGSALLQKGWVDEAIDQYQVALQINPDCEEACYSLGNALLQKGRVDEAVVQYEKALQINPDDADACYGLGNALLQKGQVDEAIAQYQKSLHLNPAAADSSYNLANALLKKGRVDEAIAQYEKTLDIKPDYVEAHSNLGSSLLQKGQVDEAIIHFQRALQISPGNAKARNNLGSALLQKGRVDDAIAQFREALQLKPDYAGAGYNLGNALLQAGRPDEAIAQYQKALQINPAFTEVHGNLGNALLQQGKVEQAVAQFQQALQSTPDSVEILNNLAWILATSPDAHIRNGVQAVRYAERACELTHHGVTVVVGTLAAAYAEAGRFDDALAAAQKACALAAAAGEPGLLKRNQELLELYRSHQPYHEAAGMAAPAAP